ncbi:MAG: FAD-binding oxidoreductase [Myxococcales bacterium]|nr:FAD-binding oxidoreductase [Myxococcales bacterium]
MSSTEVDIRVHPRAGWVEASADATFEELWKAVDQAGWSLDGVQPCAAERTVGSLLSERALRPRHFGGRMLAERLCALTAVESSGQTYVEVAAPRRSSGPDLAFLFVGAGGAFGEIKTARFSITRPAPEYLMATLSSDDRTFLLRAAQTVALVEPLSCRAMDWDAHRVDVLFPKRFEDAEGRLAALGFSLNPAAVDDYQIRFSAHRPDEPSAVFSGPVTALEAVCSAIEAQRGKRKIQVEVGAIDSHGAALFVTGSQSSSEFLTSLVSDLSASALANQPGLVAWIHGSVPARSEFLPLLEAQ